MARRLTLVLYILLILLAVHGVVANLASGEPLGFLAVAPGIAHVTFQVSSGDAEPFSGYAFKIDLDVAELRLVPAGGPSSRRTVEWMPWDTPGRVGKTGSRRPTSAPSTSWLSGGMNRNSTP